jgi:nitrite reductase (NADH) large subunit
LDAQFAAPIVIVGNGPVGLRAANELARLCPTTRIVIYGQDAKPYPRPRLTSWLNDALTLEQLHRATELPAHAFIERRFGVGVKSICPLQHCVIDDRDGRQRYSRLILATGSQPHLPQIPGIDLPGVHPFHDLEDAEQLRRLRRAGRHLVVVGGGLLGLEVARGMLRDGLRITLVEHGDRLLGNQLDLRGARIIEETVSGLGIRVMVNSGVAKILGTQRCEAVLMHSGQRIACDGVIVAAGIRPSIALARAARLAHGRGILVDDQMRTSHLHIHALGDCAEHRGEIHGLVQPGFEQAIVAARHIAGREAHYPGSITPARLQIGDKKIYSVGPMGIDERPGYGNALCHSDPGNGTYRKLLFRRRRIVGIIAIGEWPELPALERAMRAGRPVWPWQLYRFRRTGSLLDEDQCDTSASSLPVALRWLRSLRRAT